MRGTYAISKLEVENNKMGWCVFDFVIQYLKTINIKGGWYAYKIVDGIYYFKYAENGCLPSLKYRKALKKDGYNIAEAYLK